jgi:GntR family transcriptional regulator
VTPAVYTSLRRGLDTWLQRAYAAGLDEQAVNALFSTANHEVRARGAA